MTTTTTTTATAAHAAAVAACLGDGWRAVHPNPDDPGTAIHYYHLHGPDGERLWCSHRQGWGSKPGMYLWSGDFNAPLRKPYNAGDISINVGDSRNPEAHAKEITRRLLPQYRALLDQARATHAQERAHDLTRDVLANAVADLMPKAERRRPSAADCKSGDHITFSPYTEDAGHGDVRVGNTGNYVDLTLNLPPAMALALLSTWKLLREAAATPEEDAS